MNGIINIDKPKGFTSQDALRKIKNILYSYGVREKIGHTGTLDPIATGLLTVCVGKATRVIEYMGADIKTYVCTMKLGKKSDTLDATGEILFEKDFSNVSYEDINKAFIEYKGIVEQIPPKYSALKYKGKPLYEYARRGINIDIEIKKRKVFIKDIEILNMDLSNGEIKFKVSCSKGTYVRTITDDIGNQLGCGAIMTELRRISSGAFSIDDAFTIEDIESIDLKNLTSLFTLPEEALVNLGKINIMDQFLNKFINGVSGESDDYTVIKEPKTEFPFKVDYEVNSYMIYNKGEFIGIGEIDNNNRLIVKKVIKGYENI